MVPDFSLKRNIQSLEMDLKRQQKSFLQKSDATHEILDETYTLKREIALLKRDLSIAVIQKDKAQNNVRLRERNAVKHKRKSAWSRSWGAECSTIDG